MDKQVKTRIENYSAGFVAGFAEHEYLLWECADWHQGWIIGASKRVEFGLSVRAALKTVGLDATKGIIDGEVRRD
jgi:hypothetical protein